MESPKHSTSDRKTELQILAFTSKSDFETWLANHYELQSGIWIKFYKKNSGVSTIVYDQALDVALSFGWIDGQLKKFDELAYLQKFTPRRKNSLWSKRNIEKAEALINAGKMQLPGLTEYNKAVADGRHEKAYENATNMTVPQDFIQELKRDEKAYNFYQNLDRTNLYTIYWRLQTAKNETIRAKRMKTIIEKLAKEEKFH